MGHARLLSVVVLAASTLGSSSVLAAPTQPGELTNALVPVTNCEYCHSFQNAPGRRDEPYYAPYWSWRGSMMANAAVDPVFWAGVAVASQDAVSPEETEACIRCHSPRAFLEGRASAISIDELTTDDRAGIECEACHRMEDDGGIGNGQYAIDDTLAGGNVPRRGPWGYMGMGAMQPPHAWMQDDFVGSSEACGTCHDVTTERQRLDDEGNPMGSSFNEQRTYSEWTRSAFAQPGDEFRSCQDCHMPAVEDVPGCRDHVGVQHHATGGRRHDLLGANRFVVGLLAEDATVLEGLAFDHTLSVMDDFVRTSASLDISAPDSVDLGNGLSGLQVTVTNETGHKLPTGYSEGRVMWLEVVARHDGEVVWESGTWSDETGAMLDDAQLRTYQGVAEAYATGQTLHLLLNDHWIEDTRIPPRGLTPHVETDPVGERYALQDDGTWPHFDVVDYSFDGVPALADVDSGELEVSVRLLYLINTPQYIDFLAAENQTNEAGNEVAMLFETAGGAPPMVVAEGSLTIPIADAGVGTSSGGSSTGIGSGGTAGDDTSGGDETTTDSPVSSTAGPDSSSSGTAGSDDGGGGDGCGCTSSGGGDAGGLLLFAVAAWVRRRRRRCA